MISQISFNVMTEAFRTQIYELLEQSKVVHPIKDKQKRKVVGMTKDLQQILKNNEKGCLTTDGKDVETGSSQKSIKEIITDLVEALKFHKENMEQVSDDYYEYNRQRFVSRYYDRDRDLDLNYSTDLESLATQIIQIHKYNRIIITDGEGRDIRTNQIIDERLCDEI